MVTVSKAIVVSKTLWPQRANSPSMVNLQSNYWHNTATPKWLQVRLTTMGTNRYSSHIKTSNYPRMCPIARYNSALP